MNTIKNNVIGLPQTSVESKIEMFLDIASEESENTSNSYRGHIKEYFMYILKKELNQITWEELYNLTVEDTWRYRQYLKSKRMTVGKDEEGKNIIQVGQSSTTINSKIACLSALFKFLQSIDKNVNSMIMNVKRMKSRKKNTSYGALTEKEYKQLLTFCDSEPIKPLTKRMFFEIAVVSGLRKSAILNNLTWGNIKKRKDLPTGTYIWTISEVEDKGNKQDIIPISDNFYQRLMKLKESKEGNFDNKEDLVIQLDKKTVDSVLKRFKKEYNISDERNITIHSLKKTGCDIVWDRTKDIKAVCDYAHHEDINTTYNHYLGKNNSLLSKASYYIFDQKINFRKLENLSKSELLEVISKCSVGTINEIINNIK